MRYRYHSRRIQLFAVGQLMELRCIQRSKEAFVPILGQVSSPSPLCNRPETEHIPHGRVPCIQNYISSRRILSRSPRHPTPVDPELRKNAQVQHQRPRAPHQPTRIHKNVPPVLHPPLIGPTPHGRHHHRARALQPRAARLVSKDAKHIRQIPNAREEEEEQADAVGGFAAVVEQELGDAGAEVEDGAEVAEDLAPEVEVEGRVSRCGRGGGGEVLVVVATVRTVVFVVMFFAVRSVARQPPS